MAKTYFEKLQDPRWQKRRLEVFDYYKFSCQKCGDNTSPLHAHHLFYKKNRDPWEYCIAELSCLCDQCHKAWHDERETLLWNLMVIESEGFGIEDIHWLVRGIVFKDKEALQAVLSSVESRLKNIESEDE